ncbi:YlmC/YmxH family sporulation protein [Clostridium sp. MSJ-4]|uniref:YlmC/YmxH family sporulation protein n=1 Tax=Clostridium simiarum TaxID=2841506 RepID=A0ABS6EWQ7_9CLOT|nr:MULTISPECIES: YlmC/YmxH family sporulation protein [Clostridium]MBU5590657.1 YlmC/YmxH family sporulation protein [Clostridium simiarum]
MGDNIKLYSEMEKYEIININDGEKYNYLGNNDIVIDNQGLFKLLIVHNFKGKFNFFGNEEFYEIPWEYVKKIGARTIIIDIEEKIIKKTKL